MAWLMLIQHMFWMKTQATKQTATEKFTVIYGQINR